MPGSFKYNVMNELEDMAGGNDAGGIRDEYYSEWSDGDFQELLRVIKSGPAPSTDGNTDLSPDSDKLAESRRRRNRRR